MHESVLILKLNSYNFVTFILSMCDTLSTLDYLKCHAFVVPFISSTWHSKHVILKYRNHNLEAYYNFSVI